LAENQFVISIMSKDRAGIVHYVATTIAQLNGNMSNISQTVLRGYFTMILFAEFPADVSGETILQKLSEANSNSTDVPPLEMTIQPIPGPLPPEPTTKPADTYVLTASGRDRVGIVAEVSAFCVRHQLNILDLSTTVSEDIYIMILLVDLSACKDTRALHYNLTKFEQHTGLNLVLQHHDIFKATNEISRL
jgi:glycine cleavage system transcriptional repressor